LALIISIGALGLGVYQFISPPASEGPQIYILEHNSLIWLDRYSSIDYLYELNITYTTKVGDRVVLEFNCRLFVDAPSTTTLTVGFDNNGSIPTSRIYVSSDIDVLTSEYMRYTFEASTAGENHLVIYTTCFEEVDNYISHCLLTVTVYR
jgi:hypothetical protein